MFVFKNIIGADYGHLKTLKIVDMSWVEFKLNNGQKKYVNF